MEGDQTKRTPNSDSDELMNGVPSVSSDGTGAPGSPLRAFIDALQGLPALAPFITASFAFAFNAGYFSAIDIGWFTFFSLTEHAGFALRALPVAISATIILMIAMGFSEICESVASYHELLIKSRKRKITKVSYVIMFNRFNKSKINRFRSRCVMATIIFFLGLVVLYDMQEYDFVSHKALICGALLKCECQLWYMVLYVNLKNISIKAILLLLAPLTIVSLLVVVAVEHFSRNFIRSKELTFGDYVLAAFLYLIIIMAVSAIISSILLKSEDVVSGLAAQVFGLFLITIGVTICYRVVLVKRNKRVALIKSKPAHAGRQANSAADAGPETPRSGVAGSDQGADQGDRVGVTAAPQRGASGGHSSELDDKINIDIYYIIWISTLFMAALYSLFAFHFGLFLSFIGIAISTIIYFIEFKVNKNWDDKMARTISILHWTSTLIFSSFMVGYISASAWFLEGQRYSVVSMKGHVWPIRGSLVFSGEKGILIYVRDEEGVKKRGAHLVRWDDITDIRLCRSGDPQCLREEPFNGPPFANNPSRQRCKDILNGDLVVLSTIL